MPRDSRRRIASRDPRARGRCLLCPVLVAACLLASASARAATLTWSGTSGATWSTGTTNWTGSGGTTPWNATTGTTNIARFSTAGALANVSTTVTVNGILATATATIQGGTISIGGGSPTITATNSTTVLTINSVLTGAAFTKTGQGTLVLGGTNTLGAGTVAVGTNSTNNFGYLRLTSSQALGSVTTLNLPANTGGVGGVELEGDVSMPETLQITSAGRSFATATGYMLKNNSGNNTWNGNIFANASGGSYGFVSDSGTLTLTGTLTTSMNSAGARSFAFGGAGDFLISGRVVNGATTALTLNKFDSGTLILSGSNTYTGTTTITGGTLMIGAGGNTGSLSTASAITGAAGGTLAFNRSDAVTQGVHFTTAISGSIGVSQIGSGTLTLSGSNTYDGGTAINGGVLALGGTGALGSTGTISFGGGTLQFSASNTTDYSNRFSTAPGQAYRLDTGGQGVTLGSALTSVGGSLVKLGSGTLTLSGANTYDGGTAIDGGVLALGGADALGTTGTISFGGGMLQFSESNTTDYSSRFSTAPGQAYSLDTGGQGVTLGSALTSVGGSLAKLGSGTLTLSGENTYDGSTTVSAGTLVAGGTAAFGGPSGTLVAEGGVLDLGGYTFTRTGSVSFAGGTVQSGTLTNDTVAFDGRSGTVSAVLAGAAGLTKTTSGTLTLSGANTYAGNTTVAAGTLVAGGTAAFGAPSGTLVAEGGVLDLGGYAFTRTGTVSFTGGTVQSGTLTNDTVAFDGRSGTVSAVLAGAAGLTKTTSGTLTLTGSNSFGGGTRINGGVLALGSAGALGSSGTISFGGGTLQFSASNTTDYSGRFSTAAGQTYSLDTNGRNVSLASALTSSGGSLVKLGSGTLTVSGNNTYDGGTAINGGVLTLGSASAIGSTGTISFGGGTLRYSGSNATDYSGRFSTAPGQAYSVDTAGRTVALAAALTSAGGSFTKLGSGTLTLSGNNTFDGGTTLDGGVLVAGSDTAFGTGMLTIGTGALQVQLPGRSIANAITITGGGGGTALQGLLHATSGTATLTGPLTIGGITSAGGHFGAASGAVLVVSGSITAPGISLVSRVGTVVYGGGGDYASLDIYEGAVRLGATNGIATGALLEFANSGNSNNTFDLAGFDQTLQGLTKISTGIGTNRVGNSSTTSDSTLTTTGTSTFSGIIQDALEAGTRTTRLVVASGSLALTGSNTYTGGTRIDGGTLSIGGGGTSGSIDGNVSNDGSLVFNRSNALTYPGTVSGAGSLTKLGSGTLTLTGSNTYAGPTTIGAGTLRLSDGDNRLPTAGTLAFAGSGTLDVGSTSQSVAELTTPGFTNVTLAVTGGGSLTVTSGALQIGPGGPGGTVTSGTAVTMDMSGLGSFTYGNAAGVFRVGMKVSSTNSGAIGQVATVTLAATNSITAGLIAVGDMGASGDGGASTLSLGQVNTLRSGTINVGYSMRSDATFQFRSGLTSPTATFRAADGTGAVDSWLVGNVNQFFGSTNQTSFTAAVDLSDGTIDALVTSLRIGSADIGSFTTRTGAQTATFTMGSGTLAVGTMRIGTISSATNGSVGGALTARGTFTLASGGRVEADSILLAENAFLGSGASARTVSGTFNLTAGTLLAASIARGEQTGSATPSTAFNWTSGTLGNKAGGNLLIDTVPISLLAGLHVFDVSGTNSLTVNAASPISGLDGFVKEGSGRLLLEGTNTYAGATAVNAGALFINGNQSGAVGAVTVAAGAMLGGTGIVGGATTINGLHSPGASPGSQTFTNGLVYGATGTLAWELSANNADPGNRGVLYDAINLTTAGALVIDPAATLALVFNAPLADSTPSSVLWSDPFWNSSRQWTIASVADPVTWDGTLFGNIVVGNDSANVAFATARPGSSFSIADDGGNLVLVYAAVPEPSAVLLAVAGLAGLALARRRRRP